MKRLLSFNGIGTAALILAAVGFGGCASNPPSPDDEDEVAEDSAALEQAAPTVEKSADGRAKPEGVRGREMRGHQRGGPGMHGPGGPEMMLFRAAEDLDLTDAQQAALDDAKDAMRPDGERGPKPEKMAELAAAIRKGSVDKGALAPAANGADPMKEHRAKVVAAIQKLHATLTPAQRKQLVASVQSKMSERGERGDRQGPSAGKRGDKMRGPGGGRMGKTGFILRGLEVSDAQQATITAALDKAGLGMDDEREMPSTADFEAMRGKAEAALTAFASDTFDASTSLPAPPVGKMAGGPKRFVSSLAVIVPLLDADQREALAARIEEGPFDHGPGGRGPDDRGDCKGTPPAAQE